MILTSFVRAFAPKARVIGDHDASEIESKG
jgi:hypothetical protein